jgi:hypothetical protein
MLGDAEHVMLMLLGETPAMPLQRQQQKKWPKKPGLHVNSASKKQ